ncbi:hypothetical protein PV327_010076 [Microctonus hyperodae]|nr:hypothetical protein PV327_010076 [Microctonus hyperodae]
MTKLTEWLFYLFLFLGPWTAIITGTIKSPYITEYQRFILFSPVILLFLFSIYSITVVLYRTLTFNNCNEAAQQLQRHITEAQAELRIKGILQRDPAGPELM